MRSLLSWAYRQCRVIDVNKTKTGITAQQLATRSTLTVEETALLLGIGRTAAYQAVQRGELPSVRIGRRCLIPVPKLLTLLGAADTTH